jgi:hypothetical protein
MKFLKGFSEFNDLILNGFKEVCPIGELSPTSRTFTRNLQTFSAKTGQKDFSLLAHSYRDDKNVIITSAIPVPALDKLNTVLEWIWTNCSTGVITSDQVVFTQELNRLFGSVDFVLKADLMQSEVLGGTTYIVPTYITAVDSVNDVTSKIWFVNDRFEQEYGEWELVVVSTLEPIDQLTQNQSIVKPLVDALTLASWSQKYYIKSEGLPYTDIVVTPLLWHDLSNNTRTMTTEWATLVYGPQGKNIEVIRDNLTNFILANSAHPEEEWMVIYPDLFIKDEFTIVPMFDKQAIGAVLTLAEIFSPQFKFKDTTTFYKKFFPDYALAHYNDNVSFLPSLWQSIGAMVCGGARNNIVGPNLPGYLTTLILARPGTGDYDRMDEKARNFAALYDRMIVEANRWVYGATLPSDMGTITRGAYTYISATMDRVTYMVLTRNSAGVK